MEIYVYKVVHHQVWLELEIQFKMDIVHIIVRMNMLVQNKEIYVITNVCISNTLHQLNIVHLNVHLVIKCLVLIYMKFKLQESIVQQPVQQLKITYIHKIINVLVNVVKNIQLFKITNVWIPVKEVKDLLKMVNVQKNVVKKIHFHTILLKH